MENVPAAANPALQADAKFNLEKDLPGIFLQAINLRASDIHLVPFKNLIYIKYRVDGQLLTQRVLRADGDFKDQFVAKIKILGELRIDETRVPQDGRITVTMGGKEMYMRISTLPSIHGEKIVVRLLGSASDLSFEKLGFLSASAEKVKKFLNESFGLVLVVGATGSGKSTTLQSLLRTLDPEDMSISTLEDPVEYQIPGVTHSQVNHKIGFDFATGLRSLLRQDPDVIMVGEIRDGETAQLCTEAAITGHLVFSTLHANTSISTIQRLLSLEVDPYLIVSGLKLIIAQCLGRRLCPHCREAYEPSPEVRDRIRRLVGQQVQIGTLFQLYKSKEGGCSQCNGRGTKGRIGFYEVLEMSPTVKKMVLEKASENWMYEKAKEEGLITLQQDAVIKALAGEVTVDEVNLALGKVI